MTDAGAVMGEPVGPRLDKALIEPPTLSIAHIVDATDGPLVGDGSGHRIMPFAVTAALSFAAAVPETTWHRPGLAIGVAALGAIVVAVALMTSWHRAPRSAQLVIPFAFLAGTMLLMAAAGQSVHSPFVSLLVLPFMWLALYESRRAVLVAAGLSGVGVWLVQMASVSGAASNVGASIAVLVICCAGMGATLNALVLDARKLAASLREHHLALEHLSLHDPLTDLSNRRGFAEQTRRAHKRAEDENRPFSLLYIDLDHFKTLNDTLGHDAGDLLLEEVAGRLRSIVRTTDTVARLGGDEFAVLAEGSKPPQAVLLAERIDAALRLPYVAAPDHAVSASVGVAHSEDVGGDPDAVLSAADKSMFMRKDAQRSLTPHDVRLPD
jgi:diguanylate cyclase (GGDEF)-like protein